MGDFKSKLPDLKELGSMTNKLFHGIKTSVNEIIQDYKQKREEQEAQEKADEALKAKEAPVQESTVTKTNIGEEVPPVSPVPPVPPVTPVVEPAESSNVSKEKVPGAKE